MNKELVYRLAANALPILASATGALLLAFVPSLVLALGLAEWGPRRLKRLGTRMLHALAPLPLVAVALGVCIFPSSAEYPQNAFIMRIVPVTLLAAGALVPRMAARIASALQGVAPETRRAGAALGAHPLVITGTLVLPEARNGILRAGVSAFSSALAELSLVLLFSQARPDTWPLFLLALIPSFFAAGVLAEQKT